MEKTDNKIKKALLTTTVSGFVPQFEMNNVKILQQMGYEVHYASNFNNISYGFDNHRLDGTGIVRHQIDYTRSPFQIKENIIAYKQLKKVLEEESFSLLHCHTPVAAVLARLAVKLNHKTETKVVYTAHGFHFYKGASLKYWLFFYTVERFLASFTDVLITINKEDYKRAKHFCKWKKTKVKYIPGVGIDTSYWNGKLEEKKEMRLKTRESFGLTEQEVAFVSVGELIPRKNHSEVIKVLASIVQERENLQLRPFHYYICGQGDLREELEQLIKKEKMENYITLLGYQEDARIVLFGMDAFLFPSLQEGLPVAMLEAATVGLPIIARNVRGNRDVVNFINANSQTKIKRNHLFSSSKELKHYLISILKEDKPIDFEKNNMVNFDAKIIQKKMKKIYSDLLDS